jgi:hypothetical protein
MFLRFLCPRDHHEWVALQAGLEANRRNPKIDGLLSFDVKFFLKLYANPDRAMLMGNLGSRATVTKDTVVMDDGTPLDNTYEYKQPR